LLPALPLDVSAESLGICLVAFLWIFPCTVLWISLF
jgi:hypothetical protein